MDPNLQQLLWAAYPLACFWTGILVSSDPDAGSGYDVLAATAAVLVVLGHLVAAVFIVHALLRAFNIVP